MLVASCKKQSELPIARPELPAAIPVEVKNLDIKNIKLSSEYVGSLAAKRKSELASTVEGRIFEIAVQEGKRVKQGDLVVQIQPSNDKISDLNPITTPIDGIVGTIQHNPGDFVIVGEEITSVTQNQVLEININVPLEQAPELKLGLPVEIVDLQGNAIANAKIDFISPSADVSKQSVLVKAVFNNNGMFRDGSSVRARIIWSTQKGILIPTDAVSRIAGKTYVFVAKRAEPANFSDLFVAQQRPVELEARQGESYQVLSGLKPGDILITSGILNLADGTPVELENSIEN